MSLVDEMDGPWMSKTISVFGAVRSFVSQLRIGQDMTKLPMPAIFFRPYSLLECLSQRHLAYVDTLSGLTASKDPVERFLSVCAWYLSNQRNELLQFYKKPYNPILCETHECRVSFADKEAKFFAEQVSHHPPVSAVHLAIPSLKLELLCSYSFGVVFSANSVAVTTTGHMEITDNEHGDVYDAPQGMPNLSITNVIWGKRGMYWTGKIAITCEKTALRAVLDFTVDPKTDKNLVSGFIATLKEPETPVAKFSGECGGATEVVYPLTAAARPLFAPAARTKLKIQYPPIEQLAPLSSLKLWAETNKAIVADDMPRADAAKKAVEDAQRARNAQGHVQPAFFTLDAKGVWRLKPDVQPTAIVSGAAPAAAAAAVVAPASPTTEHKKP